MSQVTTSTSRSPTPAWHALSLSDVFAQIDSNENGLSVEEAERRRKQFGPNELPQRDQVTVVQIFLRQFQSPLIYILLVAAVVCVIIQDYKDALFIAAVLLLNAVIGGYQEWQAEQSSRALQKMLRIRTSVARDGEVVEVEAQELVPGDVVWLESGNRVPADLRLLTAQGLEVDESLLTGESFAVVKDPTWQGEAKTPTGDRLNMAHAGSIVVRGRAKGVVVATATNTVVGQLAVDVLDPSGGRPPLLQRMDAFVHKIAYVILAATVLIAVIGFFFREKTLKDMFLFSVGVAVASIPEGLPIALTVALSLATRRMAHRGVIVRRLAAVEGLGSCTLIASDKTGTLTCNELTVREVQFPEGTRWQVSGEGFAPHGEIQLAQGQPSDAHRVQLLELLRAAALCNEADLHQRGTEWLWRGDPTDIALLSLAHKGGLKREPLLDQYPLIGSIPFEPENAYAATFHLHEQQHLLMVKGAPERILAMCEATLDDAIRQKVLTQAGEMAERGLRVLAFATALQQEKPLAEQHPERLRFLGLVGMIDPLRPGVREAVQACKSAGIEVCMITGDHPVTALAIARELGFAQSAEQVITGQQLLEKTPEQLCEVVRRVRVFARTSPRQKLELVNAARAIGHFVAVTGDGVNDAPALRAANIGVAMGKSGTDVAREAAELVITDDNFATIVSGVEEGRVAYDNVRKVIYLLISTGAGLLLLMLLAILTGYPNDARGVALLPFLPVQLLWLNLVTNGIQDVALAFEPKEGDVLQRKPRPPQEPIFNRLMIERTILAALVMGLVCYGTWCYLIEVQHMQEDSARNILLLLMVLFQNVHIGNSRSETISAFRLSPLTSPILLGGTLLAFTIHVVSMHVPFMQALLRTEPVSLTTWACVIGLALTIIVVMEIHKLTWAWREARATAATAAGR